MSDYIHRIMVSSPRVAIERLREHGLDGEQAPGWTHSIDGTLYPVDFLAPRDVDLDFLRPDILPPKKTDDS